MRHPFMESTLLYYTERNHHHAAALPRLLRDGCAVCAREPGSSWLGFVAVFLGEEVPGLSFPCLGIHLGSNGNGITYILAC